jgi:hypothetical protein
LCCHRSDPPNFLARDVGNLVEYALAASIAICKVGAATTASAPSFAGSPNKYEVESAAVRTAVPVVASHPKHGPRDCVFGSVICDIPPGNFSMLEVYNANLLVPLYDFHEIY